MTKPRYMYTIPRSDLFNVPQELRFNISRIGSLWIEILLNEDEFFILWTQGVIACEVTPG